MKKGVVVFEGIDGAGTSTQSKKLVSYLKDKGIDAEWIYCPGEPEKNPIAKLIHDYLHKKLDFPPEVLFTLYSAVHIQNTEKAKEWLAQGKIVVMDRYFPSTLAFQGAQGMNLKTAKDFVRQLSIKPDVILYIKITPKTGFKRKKKQGMKIDRHEENLEFLQRVSDIYDELAEENTLGKWFVINGENRSIEEVFEQVRKILMI